MRCPLLPAFRLALVAAALGSANNAFAQGEEALDPLDQWGMWRGPLATGAAPHADPPTEWSEDKNVRWKAALPGLGHSTPIVWGDRIFVTAAEEAGGEVKPEFNRPGEHDNFPLTHKHRFLVLALDRATGAVLWKSAVREAVPHEGGHVSGSHASASPVTDGERVYAFFGSNGLYCLEAKGGAVLWAADLGKMHTKHGHGEGASPALHGGTLVVNWDHQEQSFAAAFDAKTGAEKWRRDRDEPTSWATPVVVEHGGRTQAIISATNRIRAYDLETGEIIWECGGLPNNVVASPVAADGIVVATGSYEKQAMLAINLDGAKGDITGSDQILWRRIRRTPYVPSPLLTGGHLYFFTHYQGVLTRADLRTGEEKAGPFRLPSIRNIYASPVAAAGRLYVTDLDGQTLVVTDAETPEPIALNKLDEPIAASAAIAGRDLFLRGDRHLYCLREDEKAE